MQEQIAKIERVSFGREDHGIVTCMVHLNYGGSGQGAGGYALDEPLRDSDKKFVGRRGTAFGMEWLIRLMDACGVTDWSELKGRTVLAVREDGDSGQVIGLKPLPTEAGKPFMFDELREQFFCDREER